MPLKTVLALNGMIDSTSNLGNARPMATEIKSGKYNNLHPGKSFLQRLHSDTSGNTLAMIAAALVPLAGMVGGGLDMSRAYVARGKLQNACDAASLAARKKMVGVVYDSDVTSAANRFFEFNFPVGTMGASGISFNIAQNTSSPASLDASASALIPTTLIRIFGKETIALDVECNSTLDIGNNDLMVVLDVTGSMNCAPGVAGGCGGIEQSDSKIGRLRNGTRGLYRALDDGSGARTRYGIMPYSGTVNVARWVPTRSILRTTTYLDFCATWSGFCQTGTTAVHINDTKWYALGSNTGKRITEWRKSGEGCIEERPTIGNPANPIQMATSVSEGDIDDYAARARDKHLQWGRYETPPVDVSLNPLITQYSQTACPSEVRKLTEYSSEAAFQTAIGTATTKVTGGTYHDIGIIWAARFLSPTGLFASQNPTEVSGFPVNKHIVFMTDGTLDTGGTYYSAYGVDDYDNRRVGTTDRNQWHRERFKNGCNRAKSMDMTIWVIALDVGDTADIEPCASSSDHFFTSDGSDLEEVFERIGQGIAALRLTS